MFAGRRAGTVVDGSLQIDWATGRDSLAALRSATGACSGAQDGIRTREQRLLTNLSPPWRSCSASPIRGRCGEVHAVSHAGDPICVEPSAN